LKSEQWVLEPLANMVIAFSIIDTGIKRYLQIKQGTTHNIETLEVLKVSIAERSKEIQSIAGDIWNYILDENSAKEKLIIMDKYWQKLCYKPSIIEGKKGIMKRVNHYGKYYLDREDI
jgi:hypothetical protein